MAKKRKYVPKDPKGLTGAVVVWLWILIAVYAVDVGAAGLFVWKLWPLDSAIDVAAHPSMPVGLAALLVVATQMLTLLILFISAIISGKWIYRADANAHVLARGLTISPPWSVGFFLVPFLCLIRPYEAMREIWQVSTQPKGWRGVREPALLRWWWGLWLVGNIAGYVASILERGHTAGEMRVGYSTLLGVDVTHIVVNLLFMAIVVRVGARQAKALEAHAVAPEEEPAPNWLP